MDCRKCLNPLYDCLSDVLFIEGIKKQKYKNYKRVCNLFCLVIVGLTVLQEACDRLCFLPALNLGVFDASCTHLRAHTFTQEASVPLTLQTEVFDYSLNSDFQI